MSSKAAEQASGTGMRTFRYRAVAAGGAVVEGETTAQDEAQVLAALQAQGHQPVRVVPVASAKTRRARRRWSGPTRREDALALAQELARLTGAGVGLERGLEILIESSGTARRAGLYRNVLQGIREGVPLSKTLAAQGGAFDAMYASVVRAGEAGGTLPQVLAELSMYLERAKELRASLRAAMAYPAILLAVSVLAVAFLLVHVVPQFRALLEGSEAGLPLATRIVFDTADAVAAHWKEGAAAMLGGAGAAWLALRSERAKRWLDAKTLRAPVIGPMITGTETGRLCRTLGMLIGNGVAILPALAISRDVCRNRAMAAVVDALALALREGATVGATLRRHREVPAQAAHMITVGEESGRLPAMLLEVAKAQEAQVRARLRTLLVLLEPVLILTMGVIAGAIIISILLAVLSFNQLAQ